VSCNVVIVFSHDSLYQTLIWRTGKEKQVGKASTAEHGKAGMARAIKTRKGKASDRNKIKGKLWLAIRQDNARSSMAGQSRQKRIKPD
jgi:hypothetical protein